MDEQKKKFPLTAKVEKLFAEWEELSDNHKAALLAKDYETAREMGREIAAFVRLHQEDLKIPAALVEELTQMNEKAEASCQAGAKAENEVGKSVQRARQSENEYYRRLLEKPPLGKNRTGH